MTNVMRCVRLLPTEDRGVTGAARFRGLTVNDFIRAAAMKEVEIARAERDRGTPPQPVVVRRTRDGLRRRPVSVGLTGPMTLAFLGRIENQIDRQELTRRAILHEIVNPSTRTEDPPGAKTYRYGITLTDV